MIFSPGMVKRISDSLSAPVTKSSQVFANISRFPFLQVNLPQLSAWVDEFIRRRLFARQFDPFEDENWRLLCLDPVANHIIQTFGRKLPELAETEATAPPEIKQRRLSEVATIRVRESSSIVTPKCIYERLPYPSRNGGFEPPSSGASHRRRYSHQPRERPATTKDPAPQRHAAVVEVGIRQAVSMGGCYADARAGREVCIHTPSDGDASTDKYGPGHRR